MSGFPDEVVEAVCAHMNGDHQDDNLTIVRAFGTPEATSATMTGLDSEGGTWLAACPDGDREVRVGWPIGRISERAEIRHQVVALHELCLRGARGACATRALSRSRPATTRPATGSAWSGEPQVARRSRPAWTWPWWSTCSRSPRR